MEDTWPVLYTIMNGNNLNWRQVLPQHIATGRSGYNSCQLLIHPVSR